ncbi:MAG TPA: ABC transporter substrate-binding protein [Alphaproteobacteria bacterium]|nr:ABC transporter substrate-binding protein [Alphaproteobacteria bacterium]
MFGRHLRSLVLASAVAATLGFVGHARADSGPIKIGDINVYSAIPQGTEPYKKGWEMALAEVNAEGGVLGRKVEVLSRDDAAKPDVATRMAQELVTNEKVAMLMGGFLSNEGLAIADFANRNKVFYLASEPLSDALVWEKGNPYTFRLRPSTYMQTKMLVDAVAKLPAKRWATVAPNYEYGQSAVSDFLAALKEKRPDAQVVEQQWPALGKLDAGAVVQALAAAKPDAIFNVTFGADLARFVREGELRGLFKGREVVSLLTGEPEYLDPLKGEAPVGWIVTGYPWYSIKAPAHEKFVAEYRKRYNETPRMSSLVGYITLKAAVAIIKKAGSTDTAKLIAAAKGLTFGSPIGAITFRAIDHQSTMGAWIGKIALKDGSGIMVDWHFDNGKNFQPTDAFVRSKRPASAD